MPIDPKVITQHAGPLPVWAWGVVGGGTLLVIKKFSKPTSGVQATQPGPVLSLPVPGGGAGDTSGSVSTPTATNPPPEQLGGLLAGLGQFINGLPNAPNDFALALPGGAIISFSNGVPTFGNGIGLQPGPTVLDPGQTYVGGNPFWQWLNDHGWTPPAGWTGGTGGGVPPGAGPSPGPFPHRRLPPVPIVGVPGVNPPGRNPPGSPPPAANPPNPNPGGRGGAGDGSVLGTWRAWLANFNGNFGMNGPRSAQNFTHHGIPGGSNRGGTFVQTGLSVVTAPFTPSEPLLPPVLDPGQSTFWNGGWFTSPWGPAAPPAPAPIGNGGNGEGQ